MPPIEHRPTRHLSFLSILAVATFAGVVALATMITVTHSGRDRALEWRWYGLLASGNPQIMGTFRTENLVVDSTSSLGSATAVTMTVNTNGQPQLFSTFVGSASNGLNIWIGGGGQSSVGSGGNPDFGSRNVSLGDLALNDCVGCYDNVAIGNNALQHDIGPDIGLGVNQGHDNIAIGNGAMVDNLIGETDIAIGGNALASNTLSRNLIAIGFQALQADTAQDNIAIGNDSLLANVTGTQNVSIGTLSQSSGNGNDNISIGHAAQITGTGNDNISIGVNSEGGSPGPSSIQNIGIGTSSLLAVSGGFQNTGVGTGAGANITNGFANAIFGDQSGGGITTGSTNTILGANVHGLAAGTTSRIILADGTGTAVDQVWLSAVAPTSVSHGTLGTGSSDSVGNVTSIGANTSVVLTYSVAFPNRSWCQATPNTHAGLVEVIIVTNSASAPTFSCFAATTGAASNCEDFTYWCTGQ